MLPGLHEQLPLLALDGVEGGQIGRGYALAIPERGGSIGGPVRYAVITGVRNTSNTAWADFLTHGYQSHAVGHPCDAGGGNVKTTEDVIVLLTPDAATAYLGYERWAVDDVVAYFATDGTATAPGSETDTLGGIAIVNLGKLGPLRGHGN